MWHILTEKFLTADTIIMVGLTLENDDWFHFRALNKSIEKLAIFHVHQVIKKSCFESCVAFFNNKHKNQATISIIFIVKRNKSMEFNEHCFFI